ncbi:MAG: site-specific DNA-methyltransferase [Verrucomicrobiota bacterium]
MSNPSASRGKYTDLTKDQLVALLRQRDETRLGLVWERDPDLIEADGTVNGDFVAWDFDESLSVGDGPYQNLLVEGENYDALRALRMTHAGRIKCIEIDPPYNTGSNDFIYNDVFLNKDHRYRHSVWIEFIHKRLLIARDLLTDDGVIFVHIGEEEVHRLGCLMDQVFPGQKVGTFVWRTRSGANDSKEYFRSTDHEYVICYGNPGFTFAGSIKSTDAYTNPDNDPRGPWGNDNLVKAHNLKQRKDAFYPVLNPETNVWYAPDADNVWRFASEAKLKPGQKIRTKSMEQIIREKKVLWPADKRSVRYESMAELLAAIDDGTAPRNLRRDIPDLDFWVGKTIGYGKPRYKRHLSEVKRSEKPFSTWIRPTSDKEAAPGDVISLEVGGTTEGTSLIQQMLGNKDFPYPKPLSLIYGLLKQATGPDDIVLDFFGGSGTTGHAVLALNAEDDGNRRFIVVSSTEATAKEPKKNVCREICRQRLAKAVEGYDYRTKDRMKHIDGLGGNFAYLRTRRLPPGKVVRKIAHGQVWTALQLMHLETLDPRQPSGPLWIAGGDEVALVYLPKADVATLAALKKQKLRRAAVYSWQPELVSQHVGKAVSVRPIPQFLMERFGLKP